nr:hypothetical protein [Crocosphaera sp.]
MRRVRVQAFLPVESYEVLAKHTKEKGQSLSGSIVALIESGLSSQKQEESLEDSDYLTKDEFNQTFEELCKRVTSNFLVIESRLKTLFTRNKTEPEPEFYLIWKRWHELANLLLGQDESLGESLSESQEKNLAPPEGLGKPVAIHSHESSNGDGVPIYKEKKEEGKKSIKSIVNSLSESPSEPTKDTASNSLSESPSEPTEDTIGDSPSESPSEPTEDTI